MKTLRGPEGCPWDRQQTHDSLKSFLIEEAYEVLDAIESEDPQKLKEELGDLFFQIIFHCQLSAECGDFDFVDMLDLIHEKLVRRHPHVFLCNKLTNPEEVVSQWHQIKLKEKSCEKDGSVMAGIPKHLPALHRSDIIQKRASRSGFDWKEIDGVLDKIIEEVEEVRQLTDIPDHNSRKHEIGDLLFSVVNLARFWNVDPEECLRMTSERFIRRFRYLEQEVKKRGSDLKTLSIEEMNQLWDSAKSREKDQE